MQDVERKNELLPVALNGIQCRSAGRVSPARSVCNSNHYRATSAGDALGKQQHNKQYLHYSRTGEMTPLRQAKNVHY
jgi:hypothetical protein